jgi:ribonuclease BN (tRNA processing enzyme)
MLAPAMRTIHDPRDGKWHEMKPGRYYVEHELDDDGKSHTVHNLEAEVYRARHVVPSMAVKLSHNGRTVGYSGDTTFDPALIGWLGSADLILHEAGAGIHADPARLAELPRDVKRRMLLIHYPDGLPGSRLGKRMGIRFAREGRTYDV